MLFMSPTEARLKIEDMNKQKWKKALLSESPAAGSCVFKVLPP